MDPVRFPPLIPHHAPLAVREVMLGLDRVPVCRVPLDTTQPEERHRACRVTRAPTRPVVLLRVCLVWRATSLGLPRVCAVLVLQAPILRT